MFSTTFSPFNLSSGVVGNSINLLVLLSSGMKNQANTLLSAMALADLGFLFCMLPHSLVSFSFFYKSVRFSYFYFLTKTHAVALANMFSTAATFLVLAVSLERFSGVRRPMHTRFQLRDGRLTLLIVSVFAFALGLSFFHHVEYDVSIIVALRSNGRAASNRWTLSELDRLGRNEDALLQFLNLNHIVPVDRSCPKCFKSNMRIFKRQNNNISVIRYKARGLVYFCAAIVWMMRVIGCDNVWANFQHISQLNGSSPLLVTYVQYAKYTQSIVGVALPVIAVAILNVSLIYFLRRREILPRSATKTQKNQPEFRRYSRSSSEIGTYQKQERKVTATVIAIISCFSLTHLPTLGPFIWEQIYSYRGMKPTSTFNNVITLLNMLLVSGKTLNFVLFCSSSAHFRRRTMMILNAHLCQDRYRKKYSSMINSQAPHGGLANVTVTASAGVSVTNLMAIAGNNSTPTISSASIPLVSYDTNGHKMSHPSAGHSIRLHCYRPPRGGGFHKSSTVSLKPTFSAPPAMMPKISLD